MSKILGGALNVCSGKFQISPKHCRAINYIQQASICALRHFQP